MLLGFLSGLGLGLGFHRENWLGGYASLKRRLYRLAHISLFALGAVNLLFYLTADHLHARGFLWTVASLSFIAGSILMPICCVVMAHWSGLRLIFGLPVISLLVAAIATLAGIVTAPPGSSANLTGHFGLTHHSSLLTHSPTP